MPLFSFLLDYPTRIWSKSFEKSSNCIFLKILLRYQYFIICERNIHLKTMKNVAKLMTQKKRTICWVKLYNIIHKKRFKLEINFIHNNCFKNIRSWTRDMKDHCNKANFYQTTPHDIICVPNGIVFLRTLNGMRKGNFLVLVPKIFSIVKEKQRIQLYLF
jgi:hypothetical protein